MSLLPRDAARKNLECTLVPVAGIDHLIAVKRRAGRGRDLDDIDKLQSTSATEQDDS